MKARIAIISVCVLAVVGTAAMLSGCCGVVRLCTSKAVALDYVGTMVLGTPVSDGKRTTIPVRFEGGAWMQNSGIVFKKFKTSRSEDRIVVTAVTCLAGGDSIDSVIAVKDPPPGSYRVVYRDPDGTTHDVGSVEMGGPAE